MNETPYETILGPIEAWSKKNYYTDFLVTILLDGNEITEVLEFDGNVVDFVWHNDWWEGEKDVKLLGFSPIGDIRLHNYPCKPITNYHRLISKTPEELADILVEHGFVLEWYCGKDEIKSVVYQPKDAKNKLIDWLKQEATDAK